MTYTYLIPQIPSFKDHVQVGATNLALKLQINEGNQAMDIADATVKTIVLQKPDGTVISASADFLTSGSDGIIIYRTGAQDLDQSGEYELQAYLELPSFTGYTTPVQFTVYPNLPLTEDEEDDLFP
jgi:hypothetical protein